MNHEVKTQIEAATFRRLLTHLDNHKDDVQNIELMIVADFCRNCLAKWYSAAAEEFDQSIDYESARELIYGEPYESWKSKHQRPATKEQLAAYDRRPKGNPSP